MGRKRKKDIIRKVELTKEDGEIKKVEKKSNTGPFDLFGTTIKEIKENLKNADGYMISYTVLKNGKLTTYFATHQFPKLDMLPSCKHTRNLIIEELEKTDSMLEEVHFNEENS